MNYDCEPETLSCSTNGNDYTLDEIFGKSNCFENVRIMELNATDLNDDEVSNFQKEIEANAHGMKVVLDGNEDIINFVFYPQVALYIMYVYSIN